MNTAELDIEIKESNYMDVGNLNTNRITVGEIPNGECFIWENHLYLMTSCTGPIYDNIIMVLNSSGSDTPPTKCICVDISDGSLYAFRSDLSCTKVLTKVSVVPG